MVRTATFPRLLRSGPAYGGEVEDDEEYDDDLDDPEDADEHNGSVPLRRLG